MRKSKSLLEEVKDRNMMPPPGPEITESIMNDPNSAFHGKQMLKMLNEIHAPHLKEDMSTKFNFPGKGPVARLRKVSKRKKNLKSKKRKSKKQRKRKGKKQTKRKKR